MIEVMVEWVMYVIVVVLLVSVEMGEGWRDLVYDAFVRMLKVVCWDDVG